MTIRDQRLHTYTLPAFVILECCVLLDVFLSIFHRVKLKRNFIKHSSLRNYDCARYSFETRHLIYSKPSATKGLRRCQDWL